MEHDVRACPEHRFPVASVSKVLTTTAAAKLESRGDLDLDGPIAEWLPDVPAHHRATTLRQLFTHRGGVRHYLPKDFKPALPGGPVFTRFSSTDAEILAAFIDDELEGPLNNKVSCPSRGYSLASLAMEAATRLPFLDLIEAEIASRFGLPRLIADQPGRIVPGRVRAYVGEEEQRRLQAQFPDAGFPDPVDTWIPALPINPAYCWAGASFLMSVPDAARFGSLLLDVPDCGITEEERALLFTPLTERSDHSPPLGLGWRVDRDVSGRRRWPHAGATPGGRASLVIDPELGLSIALASNCMVAPVDVLGPSSELAGFLA